MKHSLFAIAALLLSSVAMADLGEKHQKNCETPEVKSLVGEAGSCRIVVTPKKLEKRGVCVGLFMGALPCYVSYISVPEGAAMNLTCGNDLNNPDLNQDMSAEGTSYNVATLIRTNSGETVVKHDASTYEMVASGIVSVLLDPVSPEITIQLQTGPVSLTNTFCQ